MTDLAVGRKSCREEAMKALVTKNAKRNMGKLVPMMLQVAFSLVLWTLGGGMAIQAATTPTNEHRVVYNFAVERAETENLQRWVNAGHDAWCRDAQLVAAASMRRIAQEFDEVQPTSLPLELERREKSEAVYTFHSLDGLRTFRITLRRYEWLMPTAGSVHRMIWVPEKAEIVTRKTLD